MLLLKKYALLKMIIIKQKEGKKTESSYVFLL